MCPDRRDHATRLAHFKVEKNQHYGKKRKYGNGELRPGQKAYVDVMHEVPGQDKEVVRIHLTVEIGAKIFLYID